MFQPVFKCDSCMMESDSNHIVFRRHVCWVMSHFSLCLSSWPPSGPSPPLTPTTKAIDSPLFWNAGDLPSWIFSAPQTAMWVTYLILQQWIPAALLSRRPGLCHLSQAHKKVPAGCRFYMRGIVLFLFAEQLLLTAFSLQTCLTRLPWQTVEQLNCNQSNFIYMTSLGSPQQIFFPPPHLLGFTCSPDTCWTNGTVSYPQRVQTNRNKEPLVRTHSQTAFVSLNSLETFCNRTVSELSQHSWAQLEEWQEVIMFACTFHSLHLNKK